MLNARLARLAVAPELDADWLIVEALAERIQGAPGPACAELRARLENRPRPASKPSAAAWCTWGAKVATAQDSERSWYVLFPGLPGGIEPVAELPTAESLIDAMEEVDQRWPMRPWWLNLDSGGGVVDPCGATSGDRACTRHPGHAGAHVAMGYGVTLAVWEQAAAPNEQSQPAQRAASVAASASRR